MLKELVNFNQIKNFDLEELENIFYRCHFKAVKQHINFDLEDKTIRTLKLESDFLKNQYGIKYFFYETVNSLVILENNILKNKIFLSVAFTKEEYRKKGYMQNILLEIAKDSKKNIFVDTDSLFLIHIIKKINKQCKKYIFFRMNIKDSNSLFYKFLFAKKKITKNDFDLQEEYEINFKKGVKK